MSKLCLIYNFAQKYRTAIFEAIDKEWDCKWCFGKNTTDIEGMDTSILKDCTFVDNVRIKGSWFYQKNTVRLAFDKDISTYLILGDPHCISIWIISFIVRYLTKNKRLYFWTHGWYGKESRLTAFIKKLLYKMADGIFLYGNYAKKLMVAEGFDENKLFVIHNSLAHDEQVALRNRQQSSDIYRNHFGNDYPTLIFIGRLTKVKKLDQLLLALSKLKKEGVNCNLVFVGDGSERKSLERLTHDLELNDNVWFYGACYDDNKNAELIYNATLCVAPGNIGLTAMHTMVFGTPAISHNDFKWQMPEFEAIIPGKTGDFFQHNNVDHLAQIIKGWLETHQDREEVRKSCFEEIDNNWTPEFQLKILRNHLTI